MKSGIWLGRRGFTFLAVLFFAVGSAVSGPAKNYSTLIARKAIIGISSSGVNVMINMVLSDILPVRERPKYLGIIFAVYTVAISLGSVIGGLLAEQVSMQYTKNITRNIAFIKTLLPLIFGFLEIAAFLVTQAITWIQEPTMPLRIFLNRTTLATFGLAFLHFTILYWTTYFLPLYFRAILKASPINSGVNLLPVIAGVQCIAAVGIGVLTTTTLPAAFVRSFVFNTRVDLHLGQVKDENLRTLLSNGGAYGLASRELMTSLDSRPVIKTQVKDIYVQSLQLCWQVGIAFTLAGFVVAFIVKEVPMRKKKGDMEATENLKESSGRGGGGGAFTIDGSDST
ncbi:putative multidrug resistance protein fnx1 [Camillea tinctor]|nr:putative multidrug resistance protein fnx1 [Camillea tinctor]